MKLIEICWNGVWSWSNVAGAEDREDCLVPDTDETPAFAAELALDAGVAPEMVRFVPVDES